MQVLPDPRNWSGEGGADIESVQVDKRKAHRPSLNGVPFVRCVQAVSITTLVSVWIVDEYLLLMCRVECTVYSRSTGTHKMLWLS